MRSGGTNGHEPPASTASRRRWLDAALVLALVGIVVAVLVSVLSGGSSEPAPAAEPRAESPGPGSATADEGPLPSLVPLSGALREEGGRLWWVDRDCRAGFLDLASAAVTVLPGGYCRVWPAPDGARLVAATDGSAGALGASALELLDLGSGGRRAVAEGAGRLAAEVSWAPDGAAFAACYEAPDGRRVTYVVTPEGSGSVLEGSCVPAYLPDGELALAAGDPARLLAGGREVLSPAAIERILSALPSGSRREVSALATATGRVAAGLVGADDAEASPSASALVVLDHAGKTVFEARLFPRDTVPATLGLSPAGDALWYRDVANDRSVVVSVPGARRLSFFRARWFAWSPGGRFLAAARAGRIVLSRWPGGTPAGTIPVDAADLAWTRIPPGTGAAGRRRSAAIGVRSTAPAAPST